MKGYFDYYSFFPDELTYLSINIPYEFVDNYFRFFNNNGLISIVFFLQYVIWSYSLVIVFSKLKINSIEKVVFSILFMSIGYWSIFLLKEIYIVSGLILFFISDQKGNRFLGLLLISFRIEYLFLIIIAFVFNSLNKKLKIFILILFILGLFLFLNSSHAYPIKLAILARKNGTQTKKVYDTINKTVANQGVYNFLVSNPYRKVIVNNLKTTFIPNIDIITFQKVLNIWGLFVFLFNKIQNKFLFYFSISIFCLSIFLHGQPRYVLGVSVVLILDYFFRIPYEEDFVVKYV